MDNLFQDGGKPKKSTKSKTSSKTTKSKTSTKTSAKKSSSKKGGNFLGTVGELVAPTGWEGFATAAGLLAIDRADAALRRKKSSVKKGGSSKKGGNFLGAVGELVAPTGWGSFATAAGLLAIDRADAALRRGKSQKSSAKKGGMRGGYSLEDLENLGKKINQYRNTLNTNGLSNTGLIDILSDYNKFLEKYKHFLENPEPKFSNTNTNEQKRQKKKKFIEDTWQKLSNMKSHLRSISGIIGHINKSENPEFKKYLEIKTEIDKIITFIDPKIEEYTSKLAQYYQ